MYLHSLYEGRFMKWLYMKYGKGSFYLTEFMKLLKFVEQL